MGVRFEVLNFMLYILIQQQLIVLNSKYSTVC